MIKVMALACLLAVSVSGLNHSPKHQSSFLQSAISRGEKPSGEAMGAVSPVSTTLKCIINLTIQYLVVYTVLSLVRTYHDISGSPRGKLEQTLKTAAMTVNFAAPLCVLFIGCRMRVLWLTQGTGNPPEWVQYCMLGCAYAVLATTLTVCVIPVFTGADPKINEKSGVLEDENPFKNNILAYAFTALRYLCLIGLYGGFAGVCYGIIMFEPPKGTWEGEIPPVSPAVACTMNMSIQFLAVYFLAQVARSYSQLTGQKTTKFESVMEQAAFTVNMAPMLCILFLGARMRALQMDPINGAPQRWAQNCFYMCTYALMANTLLAILVPLVMNGEAKFDDKGLGDVQFEVQHKMLGTCLTILRFVIMLSIYGGFTAVIYSIFTIEHPDGAEKTPPISPTMQCVINLTVQFFFVYGILWVFITLQTFNVNLPGMSNLMNAMEAARATVQYAPMLAILFVGTRMRALQITQNKGAPQGWAQDGMYCATWAVAIQFWMCLAMMFFSSKIETDEDGNVKNVFDNMIGVWTVTIIKYLGLLLLYGGVITVITSIFLITKENANGRGSMPLVSDASNTLGGPPPGANDGAETVNDTVSF